MRHALASARIASFFALVVIAGSAQAAVPAFTPAGHSTPMAANGSEERYADSRQAGARGPQDFGMSGGGRPHVDLLEHHLARSDFKAWLRSEHSDVRNYHRAASHEAGVHGKRLAKWGLAVLSGVNLALGLTPHPFHFLNLAVGAYGVSQLPRATRNLEHAEQTSNTRAVDMAMHHPSGSGNLDQARIERWQRAGLLLQQ